MRSDRTVRLPLHRRPSTTSSIASRRRSRGQALVELALITPVAVVLLATAVDLGRLFYSRIAIVNAAREGAFEASIHPTSYLAGQPCDKTANRVVCRAINETAGSFVTVSPSDIAMACSPDCGNTLGNTVSVTVTGHFTLLTPVLAVFTGGTNVTFSESVTMRLAVSPTAVVPTPTPTATPSPSPTPTATPTPTLDPSATPTPTPDPAATPTPAPTPSPTPNCPVPVAAFSVTPTTGSHYQNRNFPGTTFEFTDASTNTNLPGCQTVWSWNFGDGPGVSSDQNPTYVYGAKNSDPGFLVQLVVSNLGGSSTATFRLRVS
ncbi:MAG TPA: TadE/TadG family type IV pilus assembly protein [Candidatus Limnocylindrales bacterium]